MIFPLKRMADLGFEVLATEGTADVLRRNGVMPTVVRKHCQAEPDGALDDVEQILDGRRRHGRQHAVRPRRELTATRSGRRRSRGRALITTVQGLAAAVQGIEALLAARSGCARSRSTAAALRAGRDGELDGAGCRSRARCCRCRRVGDYHPLTLVAPGVAEQTRPGHFVALAVGGPDAGDCCAGLLDLPGAAAAASTAAPWRSSSPSRAPAPSGSPRLRPHDPVDVVGPLGRPFACHGAGQRHPGRRGLRHRAAVLPRPSRCGPAAAGSTSCSAPAPRPSSSASSTPSGCRIGRDHDRRRLGRERGRVSDVAARPAPAQRADVVYACGPMAMLQAVTEVAPRARRHASARSRSRWPAASASA